MKNTLKKQTNLPNVANLSDQIRQVRAADAT